MNVTTLIQLVLILSTVCLKIFRLSSKMSIGTALPLESGNPYDQPLVATNQTSKHNSSAKKRKRELNDKDDTDGSSNRKRKRSSKYHPDRSYCLPCVIWRQSGSDPHLHEFHPIENSRHAGLEALSLSQYASFDNVNFNLESNACTCEPCYRDYNRNKGNRKYNTQVG